MEPFCTLSEMVDTRTYRWDKILWADIHMHYHNTQMHTQIIARKTGELE